MWRVGTEDLMDCVGFGSVVGLGSRAVGVDVADFFGRGTGVGDGLTHCGGRAFGLRLSDVVGVGGHSEADQLAVDGGVAGESGVEGFDDEHGCAFAEGHAVAVSGEGPAACW